MSSLEQPFILFNSFELGDYTLNPGETHSHPIQITTQYSFKIIHNALRQDHSPRFWISKEAKNQSIPWGGRTHHLNLQRSYFSINLIASQDKSLYKNLYTFLLQPGVYYVNIQNLENSLNGYRINNI
jgi:hypothetical protein